MIGIEKIGDRDAVHLRSVVEVDFWLDRSGVLLRLQESTLDGRPAGMSVELFDINTEVNIEVPG